MQAMATEIAPRSLLRPAVLAALVVIGGCAPAQRLETVRPGARAGSSTGSAAESSQAPVATGRPRRGGSEPAPDGMPTGPGTTPAHAIEVCNPSGQRAYLQRLRCPDGQAPEFSRLGLAGFRSPRRSEADVARSTDQVASGRALAANEPDFHPVDVYAVRCSADPEPRRIHLDMYHCHQDGRGSTQPAPPGFELGGPPPKSP
jgi:hypothetical protein